MRNKNVLNKLKRDYFKIPNKILDMQLSATAIALYTYLAKHKEEWNPSVTQISVALKISRTTAIKYLKELQDRNIIHQYERGRERVTSKYEFVLGKDWK